MSEQDSEGRRNDPGQRQTGSHICRICNNSEGNESVLTREMMFGTGEEFEYFRCSGCECLQISEIPEDLSRYYPPDYYSLNTEPTGPVKKFLKRLRARHALGEKSWLGNLLVGRYGEPPYAPWIRRTGMGFDSAILDVGSGGGTLLLDMRDAGFSNLTGVDPYIAQDLEMDGGLRILKRTLESVDPGYDLVMLNHSFEHSADPIELLRQVRRILKPERHALVRVPVSDCQAWQTYGADWVQLDAPRHLMIPTETTMEHLCGRVGMQLQEVVYDSDAFQFWGSEQYRRDIPLHDPRSYSIDPGAGLFTAARMREFEARATELNHNRRGDQACFYLYRPGDRD